MSLSAQKHYGFLDMHSGYLRHVLHTENEVNELGGDAEECTKEERTAARIKHEDGKFDEEHYMYVTLLVLSMINYSSNVQGRFYG